QTIRSLSGTGLVINGGASPAILTTNGINAVPTAFGGTLADGTGGLGLSIAGVLILNGISTYSGATSVAPGGVLRAQSATAFSPASAFTIGGVLDLGGYNQTVGSISGTGIIRNDAQIAAVLTAGADNASSTFSGSMSNGSGATLARPPSRDLDRSGTASLGLTKIGTGTFTLTGANNYTGATTINAGTLYVDGSIVSASSVNSGGTLGGNGTVGPVNIAGGTLAPGSQNAIGTLNVVGPLGFSANSFYNVRLTPASNDQTIATGAVTPGGATVDVSAGAGTYTTGRRTIVTAGSVNGTFNPVVQTNLAFLRPMLAYDASHVYLDITGNGPGGAVDYRTAALTYNQLRVATGLTNAAALNPGGVGGVIIGALNNLTDAQAPGVFDALSGAGIAATQNIAFDASHLVTSAMNDQGTFWREGGPDVNGITVAAPSFYASVTKGPFDVVPPPSPPPSRTWRAWFTGFGQGETIHGELPLGTSRQDNSLYGGAGGLDYQLLPNTLIGIAGGGTSGSFNVPNLATSGSVDGGHIGTYGVTTLGPFYAQSSSTFSVYANHTTRNIAGFGGVPGETERGDFGSRAWRSRLEFGDKFIAWDAAVTPFVAMEIAKLWSNAFTESGGILGLTVPAASHVSAPVFAGARFERAFVLSNGWVFTPTASLAYVHEFSPVRDLFAGLTFLPASTFTVDGARPGRDAAQIKTGAKLALNQWAAVYANFEGEFSNRSQIYAGKGGVKVSW
ncbi:MAG: autotransporter domain-containing protein, partial [Methylobacteriaceae bacterium]|nr:autotransporter domain-containing protein [Methylobacteriaceae bacterium]